MKHTDYMQRCLHLAQKGTGHTSPNPMVGCVLVCNGKVIGEGYHAKAGEPHAEINAIEDVKDKALLKKSTLYVNLEPCFHTGKTPPCTDRIAREGIPTVVIGCTDPNPLVGGKGIEKLKRNGVEVVEGVLEEESQYLNRRFFTSINKKRPFIILKWAQTQDGFIDGDRKTTDERALRITGDEASTMVHRWRSEEDAILVGKNTVSMDDPQLTARLWKGKNPVRVVLGWPENTEKMQHLLDDHAPTVVFDPKAELTFAHAESEVIRQDPHNVQAVLSKLHELEVQSVLVEGGAAITRSFLNSGLWDEARIWVSTQAIASGIKAPEWPGNTVFAREVGVDRLFVAERGLR